MGLLPFNRQAAAQQVVSYSALGLEFQVPNGWHGQEGDGVYLIQHHSIPGMLVLMPHEATSLDALRAGAHEGITESNGSSLQANGEITSFGSNGIRLDMAGLVEWSPSQAHVIALLSPHGRGVVVLAIAPYNQFSEAYRTYAETLAHSIVFSAPVTPPIVHEWEEGLRYYQLARYNTNTSYDGGSSSKEVFTLCDGYFTYYSSYSGFSNNYDGPGNDGIGLDGSGVSAAGSGGSSGTWEVVSDYTDGALLRLRYEDGNEVDYDLSYEDGKTYLDDTRYLRTEGSCQ